MEALLLNDDDSSSGDSDNNEAVPKVTVPPTAASTAAGAPPVAVVATQPAAATRGKGAISAPPVAPTGTSTPAAAPPHPAAPVATKPTGGPDRAAMLRNLYHKSSGKPQAAVAATATAPAPSRPQQQHQSMQPPQQQQQRQNSAQVAVPVGPTTGGSGVPQPGGPSTRPYRSQQMPVQPQQQQQRSQQSQQSQQPYGHQQGHQYQNRGVSAAPSNRPPQQQQQQQSNRSSQQYMQQRGGAGGGGSGVTGGSHYQQQPPQRPDELSPTPLAQIRQSQAQQQQQQQYRQNQSQQQPQRQQPQPQIHGHHQRTHQQPPQQQRQQQQSQPQGQQQRTSGSHPTQQHAIRQHQRQQAPAAAATTAAAGPGRTQVLTKEQLAVKKKKESFLMFANILIRYLEQKNPELHRKAKQMITECKQKHVNKVPGFESLTDSMRIHLRELVGDAIWKKAMEYLMHYMRKQKTNKQNAQQALEARREHIRNLTPEQRAQYQRQKQLQAQQKQQHLAQQQKQQQQQQPAKGAAARPPVGQAQKAPATSAKAASTHRIDSIMQDIHKKKEQLSSAVPAGRKAATAGTSAPPPASAPSRSSSKSGAAGKSKATGKGASATPASSGTAEKGRGGKKAVRRKSGSTSAASTASSRKTSTSSAKESVSLPTPPASVAAVPSLPKVTRHASVTSPKEEPPPKEYQELMLMIENSIEYDWPSSLDLVTDKKELSLSVEEQKLLIDASILSPSDPLLKHEKKENKQSNKQIGWSQKNVLSARAAWSRIRLKEQKKLEADAANAAPTVDGGTLTLPTAAVTTAAATTTAVVSTEKARDPLLQGGDSKSASTTQPSAAPDLHAKLTWVNEEVAEQDKTLELLSEATQLYIKGLLEKTIQCARQRQNIDGIRLWHQQYISFPGPAKGKTMASAVASAKTNPGPKPPLTLQLGCDVSRQIAQAQGNAAMTCKRMEEALEREEDVPSSSRTLDDQVLQEASSMSDASLKPLLKLGVQKADLQAKREYEVYGGIHARDAPFSRLPKRLKIEVYDFMMGSRILPGNGHYHTASDASGNISF